MFELLSSVEGTASAAIVIATLSLALSATKRGRIQAAVLLAAWFSFVVFLGADLALANRGAAGVPALGAIVGLPVALLCLALFFVPSIRAAARAMPLPALAAVNVLRLFGVTFIMLYAASRLPAPFAPSAGWGDVFIGATALPVAWLATRPVGASRLLMLVWNALGVLDLVAAIFFGATSSPGPIQLFVGPPDSAIMTTLPWLLIPGFLVPCFLVIHVMIFDRLLGRGAPALVADDRRAQGSPAPFSVTARALYNLVAHMSA